MKTEMLWGRNCSFMLLLHQLAIFNADMDLVSLWEATGDI